MGIRTLYPDGSDHGIFFAACIFGKNAAGVADKIKPKPWTAVLFAGAMLWCVLAFSGVSTFLYFNF